MKEKENIEDKRVINKAGALHLRRRRRSLRRAGGGVTIYLLVILLIGTKVN